MKKLKQNKYWILGPVVVMVLLLSVKIMAQQSDSKKTNPKETKIKSYGMGDVIHSPIFPGCEGTEIEIRKCLSSSFTEHFKNNFNSDLLSELDVKSFQKRVYIIFEIDKLGQITSLIISKDTNEINTEVKRVFSSVPRLVPGIRKNKKVNVRYKLSISWKEGQLEVKGPPLRLY